MLERLERLGELFAGMERLEHLMEQILAHLRQSGLTARAPAGATFPTTKAALLDRLRAMQAEGLTLQKMADRLNHEGVPTLSGKGRWQKGTIGNLLAQVKDKRKI
jgi:hypothetical protein